MSLETDARTDLKELETTTLVVEGSEFVQDSDFVDSSSDTANTDVAPRPTKAGVETFKGFFISKELLRGLKLSLTIVLSCAVVVFYPEGEVVNTSELTW
jgi:hypothetical protein